MNREIYEDAREVVDAACASVEALGENVGLSDLTGDVLRFEFMKYMMYLSASDGNIDWEEARCISEICRININPNKIAEYIREHDIYSTTFEREVPLCFKIMVEADNKLLEMGHNVSGSKVLLDAYKGIGELLIKCDDNIHDNEVADYNIYTNMLEEYRDRHYRGVNQTMGFTKKGSSSVAVPTKSGVSAPRKG